MLQQLSERLKRESCFDCGPKDVNTFLSRLSGQLPTPTSPKQLLFRLRLSELEKVPLRRSILSPPSSPPCSSVDDSSSRDSFQPVRRKRGRPRIHPLNRERVMEEEKKHCAGIHRHIVGHNPRLHDPTEVESFSLTEQQHVQFMTRCEETKTTSFGFCLDRFFRFADCPNPEGKTMLLHQPRHSLDELPQVPATFVMIFLLHFLSLPVALDTQKGFVSIFPVQVGHRKMFLIHKSHVLAVLRRIYSITRALIKIRDLNNALSPFEYTFSRSLSAKKAMPLLARTGFERILNDDIQKRNSFCFLPLTLLEIARCCVFGRDLKDIFQFAFRRTSWVGCFEEQYRPLWMGTPRPFSLYHAYNPSKKVRHGKERKSSRSEFHTRLRPLNSIWRHLPVQECLESLYTEDTFCYGIPCHERQCALLSPMVSLFLKEEDRKSKHHHFRGLFSPLDDDDDDVLPPCSNLAQVIQQLPSLEEMLRVPVDGDIDFDMIEKRRRKAREEANRMYQKETNCKPSQFFNSEIECLNRA